MKKSNFPNMVIKQKLMILPEGCISFTVSWKAQSNWTHSAFCVES